MMSPLGGDYFLPRSNSLAVRLITVRHPGRYSNRFLTATSHLAGHTLRAYFFSRRGFVQEWTISGPSLRPLRGELSAAGGARSGDDGARSAPLEVPARA